METKPGLKTTEFWVTILANVGSLAAALAGNLPPKYAAMVTAVSTLSYGISRGIAKQGVKPDAPVVAVEPVAVAPPTTK